MRTTKYGLLAILLTSVTALACSTKNDGGNDGPDAGDVIVIPSGGNGGDGPGTATGNGGSDPEGGSSGGGDPDASIDPIDNGGAGGAPNGGADPGGAPNGGTDPGGAPNGGNDPGGAPNGGNDPGGIGGVGGNGGSGGYTPPDREDCDEPTEDECYDLTTCNGVEEIQFLEQCNEGTCFPFDNEDRIENYTGALPPL